MSGMMFAVMLPAVTISVWRDAGQILSVRAPAYAVLYSLHCEAGWVIVRRSLVPGTDWYLTGATTHRLSYRVHHLGKCK